MIRRMFTAAAAVALTVGAGLAIATPASADSATARAAVTTSAGPAAVTAYPTSGYSVEFGAATSTGTLTWFGRSVGASGTVHAANNCRRVVMFTYRNDGNRLGVGTSQAVCNGTLKYPPFTAPADVPGGAASVEVCLGDLDFNYFPASCKRYSHP